MRVGADQRGWELADVAQEAGAALVSHSSLKAALDRDWDQPQQNNDALEWVVQVLSRVQKWVETLGDLEEAAVVHAGVKIAEQVREQDVEVNEQGKARLIKGVANDRHISVEDAEMRHGRKRRSVRVEGDTRHVLHDLDSGVIRAVGLTPANVPEATVTEAISQDLGRQAVVLKELQSDRGYVRSHVVRERPEDREIVCKAWPVRASTRFPKPAFLLEWERQVIRCPASQDMPCVPGGMVHFPNEVCATCPLKAPWTTSAKGRSVSIHPDEALLAELRKRQQTALGRSQLRERVAVEQTLAHVGGWQGRRARSVGVRKHLFDVRRCAVVHTFHVLARSPHFSEELQNVA